MIDALYRSLSVLVACAALFGTSTPATLKGAGDTSQRHAAVAGNGPILVVDQRGERSGQVQIGAGHDEILAVQEDGVSRVVARGLTVTCCGFGGVAASPRGRYVAFSQEATDQPGHAGRTEGLWLTTSTGGGLHRLVLPPAPPRLGQSFTIGPVAWSPDRYTLAYAVNSSAAARTTRGLGVWFARYDQPQPRLAVTLAQLYQTLPPPAGPFRGYGLFITALSWASDGRTLAVSLQYPVATGDGFSTAVVTVDRVTGQSRVRVIGCGTAGGDAAFAPRADHLAYITGGVTRTTLWMTTAQEPHARALVMAQGARERISSPAWSPDGRTIAFLVSTVAQQDTVLRTVDVATGQTRTVVAAGAPGLPIGGSFVRLTWMPADVEGR